MDKIKKEENFEYDEYPECAICLSQLTNKNEAASLIVCFHSFCLHCIEKHFENKNSKCPLCKFEIFSISYFQNRLSPVMCPVKSSSLSCNWKGPANEYKYHFEVCEINREKIQSELISNVDKMKQILDVQINPHLKQMHMDIYDLHVKEWDWLSKDDRDWKWWWWSNNPWWTSPCQECNNLWHMFEDEIEPIEKERKKILKILTYKNEVSI
jgi:hypothetical protein